MDNHSFFGYHKRNIIKCLENVYSLYEIFADRGNLGVDFFRGGGGKGWC